MTIDEYIATQPVNIQPLLLSVRQTIATAIPDAEERISYGMNPNPQYHDALSNGENPFKNIDFHPISDDSEWIDMGEVDDFYW